MPFAAFNLRKSQQIYRCFITIPVIAINFQDKLNCYLSLCCSRFEWEMIVFNYTFIDLSIAQAPSTTESPTLIFPTHRNSEKFSLLSNCWGKFLLTPEEMRKRNQQTLRCDPVSGNRNFFPVKFLLHLALLAVFPKRSGIKGNFESWFCGEGWGNSEMTSCLCKKPKDKDFCSDEKHSKLHLHRELLVR